METKCLKLIGFDSLRNNFEMKIKYLIEILGLSCVQIMVNINLNSRKSSSFIHTFCWMNLNMYTTRLLVYIKFMTMSSNVTAKNISKI